MIYIKNDRSVFPNNVKVSNQYENETRTIQFDLSDVQFTGNTYLICKYQNNQDFYTPLLLDSNFSIPVETFLSAQAGTYSCVIAISTATIGPDYDFSTDNPLFVSNVFTLTVDANFLTGTSTAWQLTPAAQNYFDQLIALVEKVQSDLDSGAFNGNGIQGITKISTSGLVDTYQITFTNGSTFDYQVTNGKDGQTPTITIQNGYWYINGVNTGQQAQGEQGEPGKDGTDGTDGVGIQSIEKTSTSGNVDTYTITYTNQTTSTFTVTNGVTPNITIGTVATLQPTEQATATITGTAENPVLNLGIPQGMDGTPGVNQNTLIATVEKSENPSVSDSYNTELMNLKFYGKSTQETTNGYQLFDASKLSTYSEGGATITNNGDGSFTVSGSGETTDTVRGYYNDANFKLKIGNLNLNVQIATYPYFYVQLISTSGDIIKQVTSTSKSVEITEDDVTNTNYMRFGFYAANGSTIQAGTIKPMVYQEGDGTWQPFDKNPQEVSFTPPQPLYSTPDGSVADVVNVASGNYEYYMSGAVVFDGNENENWEEAFVSSNVETIRFRLKVTLEAYATRPNGMCNNNTFYSDRLNTDLPNCGLSGYYFYYTISKSEIPNYSEISDFKEWLKTHNIVIVYQLATPTTQPIPPETLAVLRALQSNTGVTNVICNAPVSFDYEQSLQIVIQNILNAIGQTNANILLNGGNN